MARTTMMRSAKPGVRLKPLRVKRCSDGMGSAMWTSPCPRSLVRLHNPMRASAITTGCITGGVISRIENEAGYRQRRVADVACQSCDPEQRSAGKPFARPHVKVLSALHGLVAADRIIEPYEQRMSADRAELMVRNLACHLGGRLADNCNECAARRRQRVSTCDAHRDVGTHRAGAHSGRGNDSKTIRRDWLPSSAARRVPSRPRSECT